MTTGNDRSVEAIRYVAGDYELQRDADRNPGTTGALYGLWQGLPHCCCCLRRYEGRPREGRAGRGGPPQAYCSVACRARAADAARRPDLTREWRTCRACSGPFVALADDQRVCPAPWPASPHTRHPACAAAWRREINRLAQQRHRDRAAAARRGPGAAGRADAVGQ